MTLTFTPLVLLDTKIHLASADLTGFSNKVALPITVDALEKTTFGSGGWKERVGGLFDLNGSSIEGFWQAGDLTMPDDTFWANLGSSIPATFIPTGGAVGDLCFFTKVLEASYDPSGSVGELFAWAADLNGNAPVVRGVVSHPNGTPRTASGTGTIQQFASPPSAAQRMWANLHVFAAAGTTPSLIVKVQSAATVGFSSPTDRITFNTATGLGAQNLSVIGAITDQYWRVSWTIAGTTPSFTFEVALGVAAK